jgi:hypothetical protein
MSQQNDERVFGEGFERCPKTGCPYETGSGALSKEQQTALFMHQAVLAAVEMPKEGERCMHTGRFYETGSGCLSKAAQTNAFLNALPQSVKDERRANAEALAAAAPAGRA